MAHLARRTLEGGGPRTRVLLVRAPMRAVQAAEQPASLPLRLALGVIASVGGIVLLWFIGFLGYHFGFSTLLGASPLRASFSDALVCGILILIEAPRSIFEVALREPMWFLLGFLLIAIPGGALGAARRATPGGPRPHPITVGFTYLGAIVAILYAASAVTWMLSPLRHWFIAPLPLEAEAIDIWAIRTRFVAGLDLLALTAAILWLVLAGRLAVPLWMRSLTVTACLAGAILLTAAAAMTSGAVVQASASRPIVLLAANGAAHQPADEPARAILLGSTPHHLLVMSAFRDELRHVRLLDPASTLAITGNTSVINFLREVTETEQAQ